MEKMNTVAATLQQAARNRWGDDFIAPLVREYCRLENLESAPGSTPATPKNRRSYVVRFFEGHNCTAQVLLRIAEACQCEISISQKL